MKNLYRNMLVLMLLLFSAGVWAQQQVITGTVNDDTGVPMPGVNILLKGTNTGTTTDADGKYSISVAPGDGTQTTGGLNLVNQNDEAGVLVKSTSNGVTADADGNHFTYNQI